MKLPIQAQPVMRILAKTVGATTRFGVSASGKVCSPELDCPKGYWCCGNKDGTGVARCVPCPDTGLFGECHSGKSSTCEGVGLVHWS